MYKITAKELTKESFQKYGVYQNLLDNDSMKKNSIFSSSFFADLVAMDFGGSTLPTVSVCHVKKQEKNIVSFLEAHQYTCEGLLPLDGDVIIFVSVPDNKFSSKNLEAFYIPKGTFVKLNPLIVHGTQYPVKDEDIHIMCLLPGRTFKNDLLPQVLEEDEKVEIIG